MKRKLKWLAIVLAVSVLGFGTALLLWPRDRITAESYKKIRIGMKVAEVEEILGGAAMDLGDALALYTSVVAKSGKEPLELDSSQHNPDHEFTNDDVKIWVGREAVITTMFDRKGHVTAKILQRGRLAEPNLIDRLRDRLGW